MLIVLLDRIVFIPGPECDYEQVTCHQGTQSLVCRRPSSQTGGGTSVWSQLGGVAAGRSLQVGNRSLQKLTCCRGILVRKVTTCITCNSHQVAQVRNFLFHQGLKRFISSSIILVFLSCLLYKRNSKIQKIIDPLKL